MEPLTFQAATYRPTSPFTGTIPLSLLRVKNMILTGLDDLLYLRCYKGNLNLSETIATGPLTGTISGSLNGSTITGAGTAFKTELRSGQFLFAGADLLVVSEVVSDTVFTIYRALTAAVAAGSTGYRLSILFEIGRKRGTLLQGNGYEFDKGNIVATGVGTLRVNGSALNATMVLTRKPRIAVYDPSAGTYTVKNLGLTPSAVAPTITLVAGGVKNMQAGHYSLLLVPSRTALNGAGNPGPKAEFDIVTPGNKPQIDVTAVTVDTTNGQTEFDVYVSLITQGGIQGPWFYLESVVIANIVANVFTVEWESSQVGRTGNEVDYDNDPPPEAGFIGTIVGYAIALSCNGKFGGTPGKSIVPAKPGNIDAWPAEWNVTSSPPEDILGFATALARLYLLTPKSLQQLQYTPSGNSQVPPYTMRPYWRVGFANPYQLVFVNQMLVGHSLMGPTKSVEGNQNVVEQTDFGGYVSDIMATWTNGHVMVEHDPDPRVNAVCFFHSADSKNAAGYWRTRVLVWGVRQEQWIGDVFIEDTTRDMIVCGVAQVDGHLEFLAGGRLGAGVQVDTFRWNTVSSGNVNYYAAWQLTNAGTPRQDKELGAIQVTGKFTAGDAKVYGYSQTEAISLADIEAGTNSLSGSISLGTQASPQDLERLELNISNAAKFTVRVGGTWDSTGDPDRLDKVVLEYQPVGMPR